MRRVSAFNSLTLCFIFKKGKNMSVLVLDDCLTELFEAERCINMITEIDPYSEIFEAADEEVKAQIENNNKATDSAISHLKKAAEAVLNMIRNIIDSMIDFFKKRRMSDLEREAYNNFKEAVKKDPSIKNKKVTVTDFRKLKSEYNEILADVEKYDRALAEGKKTDVEELTNAIGKRLEGIAKGVSVSVSCDMALKMATSSRELSQLMLRKLQEDERIQKILVDGIGKKQAKTVEKDLKSLGKRLSLKRFWMKRHGQMCDSVDEAIYKTFTQVKDLCTNPSISNINNNKTIIKGVMGNEDVKKTMGDAKDILNYSAGTAAKYGIDKKVKGIKNIVKNSGNSGKKNYNNRSAFDAIIGTDNPNSPLNKTAQKVAEKREKRKLRRKGEE